MIYRDATVDELNLRIKLYQDAGLIVDSSNDLFIRDGYGALAYVCGDCSNLDEVMKKAYEFDNFYDFPGKIESGYNFVIGPGIHFTEMFGFKVYFDYAVYCTNYLDVIFRKL